MCILFYYSDSNPKIDGYRLIIASNRDEYYKRPAKTAFHCPKTDIIGGRDMEPGREGGMWLGISLKEKFKFGVLLNLTGEQKQAGNGFGRGFVVHNYLKDETPLPTYLQDLGQQNYNAYNFVGCELSKDKEPITAYYCNCPELTKIFDTKNKTILTFGNSCLDCPLAKVSDGKQIFEEVVSKYNTSNNREVLLEQLLGLLKNNERHLPDPELKRRVPDGHEYLSSIYLSIPQRGYGTRTHSIILIDYNYNVEFIEHTMRAPIDPHNPQWDENVFKLKL